jgi:hypothetical protein
MGFGSGGVSEFDDQVFVFRWAELHAQTYPELEYLFATLNGVRLRPILIAKMVACGGLVKGVPDIWFPVRRGPCPGLVIELKAGVLPGQKKNYPTPEQRRFLAHLCADGWEAGPVWGGEAAVTVLQSYLARPKA